MQDQRLRRNFDVERLPKQESNGCFTLFVFFMWAFTGIFGVLIIGHLMYQWAMGFALASGFWTRNPYATEGHTVGTTLGLTFTVWGNLLLYVIAGAGAGVCASIQCVRFRRYWSHPTRETIIALTLVNGIATLASVGILIALILSHTNFPQVRSSTLPDWRYWYGIGVVTFWGLALLSLNLVLPKLVRAVVARRRY